MARFVDDLVVHMRVKVHMGLWDILKVLFVRRRKVTIAELIAHDRTGEWL